jgi:ribosomal protein S12 methylthiotransferase
MKSKSRKIRVVTLGCPKNIVDSEVLLKQLETNRIKLIPEYSNEQADTVIINTCGFILDAKQESIDTILEYAREKERGNIQNLYVIGCLSELYKDDLRSGIPEVDRFFGVNDLEEIVNNLGLDYRKELVGERHLTTPGHYAYLKISEGCDRTCAFCAIPLIRGHQVSKPVEEVVSEAEKLADKGVKEIILIAQDLTWYGIDRYKEQKLKDLLTALFPINGIAWIRLHYAYPARFPLDILPLIQGNEKICSYLDIPVQHINETVLQRMRRGTTKNEILNLLADIRKEVPGIALRTTLLTGHPGETDSAFHELERFVIDARFDRLGIFTYSHEEGTYGHHYYRDEVPEKIKLARKNRIMEIQQNISGELNNHKIGALMNVIIDRQEGDYYVGRTEYDSPEIDNEVLIEKDDLELMAGEFYPVRITAADEFDLYGKVEGRGSCVRFKK